MSNLSALAVVLALVAAVGYGLWARQRRARIRQQARTPDDLYPLW